ncbi:MAG: hypothetical protein ABH864_05600 [archaeon]
MAFEGGQRDFRNLEGVAGAHGEALEAFYLHFPELKPAEGEGGENE